MSEQDDTAAGLGKALDDLARGLRMIYAAAQDARDGSETLPEVSGEEIAKLMPPGPVADVAEAASLAARTLAVFVAMAANQIVAALSEKTGWTAEQIIAGVYEHLRKRATVIEAEHIINGLDDEEAS